MKLDEWGIFLMGVGSITLAGLRVIQACEKARERKLHRSLLWDDFDFEREWFDRKRAEETKGDAE